MEVIELNDLPYSNAEKYLQSTSDMTTVIQVLRISIHHHIGARLCDVKTQHENTFRVSNDRQSPQSGCPAMAWKCCTCRGIPYTKAVALDSL